MEILTGSNDQMIVKGKRTKRLRPSSSTSSSGGGGCGKFSPNSVLVSSPLTTSSGISSSIEEDEDMANCLILLARGGLSQQTEEEIDPPENKFSSRKLMEMATATIGKVGIYLYECKTCSRTFPSFQALGGHRASHKKPKASADVDQKKPSPAAAQEDHEEEDEGKFSKFNTITPSTSPRLPNVHGGNKAKIHECSLCGSEFASGQALGGHMRRHRSAINVTTTRSGEDSPCHDVSEKTRNVLALDLNLPAPPEDDGCESEFHRTKGRVSCSPPRHWWIATTNARVEI